MTVESNRAFGSVAVVVRELPDRAGFEFIEPGTDAVLVTVSVSPVGAGTSLCARVWQEIDLDAFEAMAAHAEARLNVGAGTGPARK